MSNEGEKNKYQFLRGALNQDGFAGTALLFNLAARAGGVSGVGQATGEHASRAATIIISPFLRFATRKLIKEGRATERSSARFRRGGALNSSAFIRSGRPSRRGGAGVEMMRGCEGVMGKLKPHRRCLYKLSASEERATACFVSGGMKKKKNHPRRLCHYGQMFLPIRS